VIHLHGTGTTTLHYRFHNKETENCTSSRTLPNHEYVTEETCVITEKSTAIILTQLYYPSHLQPHNSTVAMRDHDRSNISSGSFLVSRADCNAAYSLNLLATQKKNVSQLTAKHTLTFIYIGVTVLVHQFHKNLIHEISLQNKNM
jgi:hypothetical protein